MTREQLVLDTLFERFPMGELGGGMERDHFERLRSHCGGADNLTETARRLHGVTNCDDLALSILWISERLAADPTRSEPSEDEEHVFVPALRKGLGLTAGNEQAYVGQQEPTSPDMMSPLAEQTPTTEETPAWSMPAEHPPAPATDPVTEADTGGTSLSSMMSAADDGVSEPGVFGRVLDQFLEAVQSGTDDRAPLLARIRANCTAVLADSSVTDDYRQYAQLLDEFLHYVDTNQLLDDVRVMNLVTNIQDPFNQWLNATEDERAGLLEQATELLRDFRTMFE